MDPIGWIYVGANVATGIAAFSLGRLYRKNRIYREGFEEGFEKGIEYLRYSIVKIYLYNHPRSKLKEKENFQIRIDKTLLDKAEKNAKTLEGFLE